MLGKKEFLHPLTLMLQILLLFLQNMDLLLQKTSEEGARKYLLPLICNALSSETVKIQVLLLVFPFGTYFFFHISKKYEQEKLHYFLRRNAYRNCVFQSSRKLPQ